jgi:hypothetical protein
MLKEHTAEQQASAQTCTQVLATLDESLRNVTQALAKIAKNE